MNGKIKIGVLFMLLIVALALIGVGYGLWFKILYIEGSVATGNVDAYLTRNEVDEGIYRPFNQDNWDNDIEFEGKNVADCDMWLSQDGQTMYITITNGYPSFSCWVEFDLHSSGTIPVRVHQPVFYDVPDWLTLNLDDPSIPYACYHDPWFREVGDHPQLHQGDQVYCVIYMHVEQWAPQGATATFTGEVFVHQWNEEP
jgi:hypothetical protein